MGLFSYTLRPTTTVTAQASDTDLFCCRGFAFIEFVTKQEAKNAMDSIAGAHLYGRRLVVEWAEQGDEGLDEIRAKTAAKFRGETVDEFDEMPAKRRKAIV